MQAAATPVQATRPPVGNIVWGIILNAIFPVILYKLSLRYISPSEFTALVIAAIFPLGKNAFDLIRHHQLDPIAIVVLLGLIADGVAILFGGSPRLLLVRESMFTGAFGVACFFSLLLPRPMMFYFARYFIAGAAPERQIRFNRSWQLAEVRFCHRLITTVWGCVFVGELIIRIILIYRLQAALVLVISPILIGVFTVTTMIWAFRYGHRVRMRALAWFDAHPEIPAE
ncbi:MAG TPA: VC0807 family protein [Candidatus Angelobacter sp.]